VKITHSKVLVRERAGRTMRRRALLDVDAEAWDTVMALNARAPHLLVRAASDLLRAARGSVVNIVDLAAFQPWTDYPAHSVSKAALAHLTTSIRRFGLAGLVTSRIARRMRPRTKRRTKPGRSAQAATTGHAACSSS
ncbi:MAG TPA: SDR family oxidoreductase, partial [Planctomycetes bacterium]|nr:SDR family oxidoreductase [Planctomycetota bacterium]